MTHHSFCCVFWLRDLSLKNLERANNLEPNKGRHYVCDRLGVFVLFLVQRFDAVLEGLDKGQAVDLSGLPPPPGQRKEHCCNLLIFCISLKSWNILYMGLKILLQMFTDLAWTAATSWSRAEQLFEMIFSTNPKNYIHGHEVEMTPDTPKRSHGSSKQEVVDEERYYQWLQQGNSIKKRQIFQDRIWHLLLYVVILDTGADSTPVKEPPSGPNIQVTQPVGEASGINNFNNYEPLCYWYALALLLPKYVMVSFFRNHNANFVRSP